MFSNRNLVKLLYNLNLIENYASGFERIFSAYKAEEKKPKVEDHSVSLKVTLLNTNYTNAESLIINSINTTEQEKVIMDFLETHESIRRVTVEDLLGIKESRARDILRDMVKKI